MPLAATAAPGFLRPPRSMHFLSNTSGTLKSPGPDSSTCFCSIDSSTASTAPVVPVPATKKRNRYRRLYPGEVEGIAEEMRFVTMRLRNNMNARTNTNAGEEAAATEGENMTWQASMAGFLKYLVDSKVVFETLEQIVDESTDVAYVYFRKSGLERSAGLAKDLEWFKEQGIVIPEPSSPGVTYASYLKEIAEANAPSFLCHYYNIYFAHVTGGIKIGKKICEQLIDGRELEFYKWDSEVELLLREVRDKLNKLSEHWTREDKNRCLKETTKSFRYSGQIVRLIIS